MPAPFRGSDRGEDLQQQRKDRHHHEKGNHQNPHKDKHQGHRHDAQAEHHQQQGDLEVERLAAVMSDEGTAVLFHQPEDQGTEKPGENPQQVAKHRKIALLAANRRKRRRQQRRTGGGLFGRIHDPAPPRNSNRSARVFLRSAGFR